MGKESFVLKLGIGSVTSYAIPVRDATGTVFGKYETEKLDDVQDVAPYRPQLY